MLTGCGSGGGSLDTAHIERAIAESIADQHQVYADVRCPRGVPQEQGRRFRCTAALQAGRYVVPVTQLDDRGRVSWRSTEPLMVLDVSRVKRAIQSSIRAQRGAAATVDCPSQVLQRKGVTFRCEATVARSTARVAAGRYAFRVTEVDGGGHVTFVGT